MDELKGRSIALSSKRLLMGLLGYSVKAQVSKESSALLKTIQHEEAGFQARNNTLQFNRQRPYVYSPFNCYRCCPPGHFARNCGRKRGRGNSRRYISNDVNFVRASDAFFFLCTFLYLWNLYNIICTLSLRYSIGRSR